MSGGYAKVHSAPCAYDQGADAERDDPKSALLLWFSHPQIWRVAGGGGIGVRVLHLFYVAGMIIGSATWRASGSTWLQERAAVYMQQIVYSSFLVCGGAVTIPVTCRFPVWCECQWFGHVSVPVS